MLTKNRFISALIWDAVLPEILKSLEVGFGKALATDLHDEYLLIPDLKGDHAGGNYSVGR